MIPFQIEDPEENWMSNDNAVPVISNTGSPPAKKKKYKEYDIALENTSDGGKPLVYIFIIINFYDCCIKLDFTILFNFRSSSNVNKFKS